MVEPADAKELIDDAIERAEAREEAREASDRARERDFRNRVSIMVGVFAVLLAFIHVWSASETRLGLFDTIEASDTYAYMEAKIIRETVLKTAAASTALTAEDRAKMQAEALRLRRPDAARHGIDQLRVEADRLRAEGHRGAERGERYEISETGLQIAIVLLSIALVAQSWRVVWLSALLAALSVLYAIVTALSAG